MSIKDDSIVEIVKCAKLILERNGNEVEYIRKITDLQNKAGLLNDPDFIFLNSVNADTVQIPLGAVRKKWSKSGLQELDDFARKYIDDYRTSIEKACKVIVERFS